MQKYTQENKQSYYLRASSLSHMELCPKRSKIESFYNLPPIIIKPRLSEGAIATGNRLHYQYSYGVKDFDRMVVRYRLDKYRVGTEPRRCFEKKIGDNIFIRGMFDDLNVLIYKKKKYVSLIELKTTRKKYMWSREILSAIRQLQLYMWLIKDILEEIGYPLWKRGYVEIYSQKNGRLMKRVTVEYDDKIEDWILDCVDKYNGLSKMDVPPKSYCKLCPKQVKSNCSWYAMMEINKH